MDHFHAGFVDELVRGFAPLVKQAVTGDEHDLPKRIGGGVGQFARGTLGAGLLYKLVDPDVSVGDALKGGAAVTGGGMAGSAAARKLKLGTLAGGGLSLLGSALGVRLLRALNEKSREERARGQLFKEGGDKTAGLPSHLKKMTKLEGGVTKVKNWPKDKRLIARLEMHQAGKQLPLAPKSKDPEWLAEYRASHAAPPEGSQIELWKKVRELLQGKTR